MATEVEDGDNANEEMDLVDWTLELEIERSAKEAIIEMATTEGLHVEEFIALILERFIETEEEDTEDEGDTPEVPEEGTDRPDAE